MEVTRPLTELELEAGIGSLWVWNFNLVGMWLSVAFMAIMALALALYPSFDRLLSVAWTFSYYVAYALGSLMQQLGVRTRTVLSFAVFFASLSAFLYVVDLFVYKSWAVGIVGAIFWIPLSLSLVYNLIRAYEGGKKTLPQ